MAVGKPIVMGVEGDAADLVTRAVCGTVVEPESANAIAMGIEGLAGLSGDALRDIGHGARKFYDLELSVSSGTTSFAVALRRLIVEANCRESDCGEL